MLALLGKSRLLVYRRPVVAILSSGDELLPVDAKPQPGKLHDANTHVLAALASQAGAGVIRLGIAADNRLAVDALLERAISSGADMILSSAGVSVGALDFVREAVEARGSVDFWKVNMRPGKPLAFGTYRDTPFFGLPGNPVSAFVGFLVFVAPGDLPPVWHNGTATADGTGQGGAGDQLGWAGVLPAGARYRDGDRLRGTSGRPPGFGQSHGLDEGKCFTDYPLWCKIRAARRGSYRLAPVKGNPSWTRSSTGRLSQHLSSGCWSRST
jgi:molybdenum cofactor synthesis domain-containing protein